MLSQPLKTRGHLGRKGIPIAQHHCTARCKSHPGGSRVGCCPSIQGGVEAGRPPSIEANVPRISGHFDYLAELRHGIFCYVPTSAWNDTDYDPKYLYSS